MRGSRAAARTGVAGGGNARSGALSPAGDRLVHGGDSPASAAPAGQTVAGGVAGPAGGVRRALAGTDVAAARRAGATAAVEPLVESWRAMVRVPDQPGHRGDQLEGGAGPAP